MILNGFGEAMLFIKPLKAMSQTLDRTALPSTTTWCHQYSISFSYKCCIDYGLNQLFLEHSETHRKNDLTEMLLLGKAKNV